MMKEKVNFMTFKSKACHILTFQHFSSNTFNSHDSKINNSDSAIEPIEENSRSKGLEKVFIYEATNTLT